MTRPATHWQALENRLKQLPPDLDVGVLGQLRFYDRRYPLYRVRSRGFPDHRRIAVLLSGGVHGDEPAGMLALLDFMESVIGAYADRFQFLIYPCVNPSGIDQGTLENAAGINLNRMFGCADPPQEVQLIQEDLQRTGLRYRFSIDMHEAPPDYVGEGFVEGDNPRACWLYESQRDPCLRLGRKMIDTLPEGLDYCDWDRIYEDRNDRGVVCFLPEETCNAVYAQRTTFDSYLFDHYTGHSFTTETPTGWSLAERIRTHGHFLEIALTEIARAV